MTHEELIELVNEFEFTGPLRKNFKMDVKKSETLTVCGKIRFMAVFGKDENMLRHGIAVSIPNDVQNSLVVKHIIRLSLERLASYIITINTLHDGEPIAFFANDEDIFNE